MSTVPVSALIRAKKGMEKKLEEMLKSLVVATHEEPGCVKYALHRIQGQPGSFVFIERWKSAADLQKHLLAPHIQTAMARKEELIESIDIWTLESVPAGKTSMETF